MDQEIGKFVERRLHPVRVSVSLMNQQLELAKGSKDVVVDSDLFESLITTFEIFLEDYDGRYRENVRPQTMNERKFVEAAKATIKI